MRHRTAITQIEGEAALYALGSLPTEEAERFRRRLDSGCARVSGCLDECREVVTLCRWRRRKWSRLLRSAIAF